MPEKPAALAICTTALGDTLMCTPAIKDLASVYRVDVLAHQRWHSLLWHNPSVRAIHPYRNNAFMRGYTGLRLLGRRYECVLLMHFNSDIIKLLPLLRYERAANVQGWAKDGLRLTALEPDPEAHFVEHRLMLSSWAGAEGRDGPLRYYCTPQELKRARAWIEQNGLGGAPLAVLNPGAALLYKRWPVDRFAGLARELSARGVGVLVMGSKAEENLFRKIAEKEPRVAPALGLDLRLAGAILAESDLLIGNDTGPQHLAQAVGTKALVIFGPSPVSRVGPRGDGHRVISCEKTCDPCLREKCRDPFCLNAIEVDQVLDTALEMISRSFNDHLDSGRIP